jgi:type I restriction enzyme S subunit
VNSVPNLWRVARFRDVLVTGVRNGVYKPAEFHGRGAKIVNMGELFGHPRLRAVPMRRIDVNESELERFGLNAMDLLFARRSLVAEGAGKCSIVLEVDEPTVFESSIIRARPNVEEASPLFLYYLWLSPVGAHLLDTIRRQVAVSGITGKDLEQLPILLPPPAEQRGIASLLGALDDKIEHNRRTAQALERLERTLFRAWFVDFEPVKAKAEGATAFPSMAQDVFDALPTRFVGSAIGPVPEGWEVKAIATIATFLNGLALQKYPPRGDGHDLRVIKIAQLRKGSTEGADWANADVPAPYVVEDRDLLFSWSGTLEAELWFGGRGALNQHLFKVTSSHFPQWFCLLWIRQHLPWFRRIAASKATTMGHIQRGHLQEAKIVVPPAQVMGAADEVLGALSDLHAQVQVESAKLGRMRDFLLPKLLSGEVRIDPTRAGNGD